VLQRQQQQQTVAPIPEGAITGHAVMRDAEHLNEGQQLLKQVLGARLQGICDTVATGEGEGSRFGGRGEGGGGRGWPEVTRARGGGGTKGAFIS